MAEGDAQVNKATAKWFFSIKSPEGYGFDASYDSEADFVKMINSLKECADQPEGLAPHIRDATLRLLETCSEMDVSK